MAASNEAHPRGDRGRTSTGWRTGTTDEVLALYADGATVEDPVGTEVRSTRESIREFYSGLEGLEQEGQAAHRADRRRPGGVPVRAGAPRPATDLHAGADRRDDLRRRRHDHLDAGLLGRRRHGRQLTGLRRAELMRPPDGAGGGAAQRPDHGALGHRQPGQPQRQPASTPASARPRRRPARRTAPGRPAAAAAGAARSGPPPGPRACRAARAGRPRARRPSSASVVGTSVAPSRRGDLGGLRDVLVAAGLVERPLAVDGVGPQEAVDLGDVHPPQQVRVRGGVRRAVRHLADDPLVDRGARRRPPAGRRRRRRTW